MKENTVTDEILREKNKTEELDKCSTAAHAEMARNTDADEPCDDDRS